MTYTTEFERIILGDGTRQIVVMVCKRCGSLTSPTTWTVHAQWHAAQESGDADASALAVTTWVE